VDAERGNVRKAWMEMGSPLAPTSRQVDDLQALSEPTLWQWSEAPVGGRLDLDVRLGRNGIALVEISPAPEYAPSWLDDARLLGHPPESQTTQESKG
jgi:xylan 1,4-beta-xylosidase